MAEAAVVKCPNVNMVGISSGNVPITVRTPALRNRPSIAMDYTYSVSIFIFD